MSKEEAKSKFQAPTGMHDILPEDMVFFDKVINTVSKVAHDYCFSRIETPVLENIEVYQKSTGLTSDIVEKEMYVVRTKGDDTLCLRPEFTPGIVRAYLQHGMFSLPKPVKLFSHGPLFRYERPQAGRYRQFNQFNFEIFGSKDPIVDAQTIQMFYAILQELKFKDLEIQINNIGCALCRPQYRKVLMRYLKSKEKFLSSDSQRRLKTNPLRILDSKDEKDREIINQAPQVVDYLCEECHAHFKKVLEFLDEADMPFTPNPYLVRGLDYYTKTVFEIKEKSKEGDMSSTLIGGGRYDSLIKSMGGPDTPAFGGAGGIERIVAILKERGTKTAKQQVPQVFLAPLGDSAKKKALLIFEELRKENIKVMESFSKDSLKNQLALASKLGIRYVLILGQREVLDDTIIIRDMEASKQMIEKSTHTVKALKKLLKK